MLKGDTVGLYYPVYMQKAAITHVVELCTPSGTCFLRKVKLPTNAVIAITDVSVFQSWRPVVTGS